MNENQRKDKERVRLAWDKKLARFDSQTQAIAAGYSYQAIADALGVTRQRIYNQIQGQSVISAPLRAHLTPMLKLPALKAQALPPPKPATDPLKYAREQSRRIQRQVKNGEVDKIPSIFIEDPKQRRKWQRLVKKHGGKSAAIRALIDQS